MTTSPPLLKRLEFTLRTEGDVILREPQFVEDCSELPLAVMRAVEDFLEAHDQEILLPLTIHVKPSDHASLC